MIEIEESRVINELLPNGVFEFDVDIDPEGIIDQLYAQMMSWA